MNPNILTKKTGWTQAFSDKNPVPALTEGYWLAQRDAQAATAAGWKLRQYELRKQYDADGDGMLSTAEKFAMRRELVAAAKSASE